MKKILMVTFAALLLLSLAACSATPKSEPASPEPGVPEDGAQENATNVAPVFGKIKSLVGNELSLELANLPESNTANGEDGASYAGEITAPAQSITITDSADEEANGGEASGDGDTKISYNTANSSGDVSIIGKEDMPKLELEYTGETKELTIPAGLKIYDITGKEIKMADLKEGNVLMVTMAEDGGIASIAVME